MAVADSVQQRRQYRRQNQQSSSGMDTKKVLSTSTPVGTPTLGRWRQEVPVEYEAIKGYIVRVPRTANPEKSVVSVSIQEVEGQIISYFWLHSELEIAWTT